MPKKSFLIVGVGSSAGGLEALIDLLSPLPKNINMAFVLVQHLEPQHKSILSEILARHTALNICQAKNNMKIEPAHIYVIPPNANMSISSGRLKITVRPKHPDGKFLPIDYFLTSLAEEQGDKAIGVILSGTGTDGTKGIMAIKEKDGMTFAQDTKTAKYSGMPESAIASQSVDFVLNLDSIAKKLVRISSHQVIKPLSRDKGSASEEDAFNKILVFLRDLTRVDFIHYKRPTISRRIMRRMAFYKFEYYSDYYNYLKSNPAEAEFLYKDILIPVTSFFRDPQTFKALAKKVFPAIVKNHSAKDPVRIWVPACSTGEEVYSLAIALSEFLGKKKIKLRLLIFGTDISETQISKARSASYKEEIAKHISPERLRRYFIKTENGYRIAKHIRDMCIFARQDLTNDPPLANMDIASCRNMLIYLDTFLQNKALSMLHYALKPKGFLILGTAESASAIGDLLTVVDKTCKIYTNKIVSRMSVLDTRSPLSFSQLTLGAAPITAQKSAGQNKAGKSTAERKLLKSNGYKYEKLDAVKLKIKKWDPAKLEKELTQTKKDLNEVIEYKDTVNEELKAANEEIQSSNEELQSTNEELETSKEELQSTNEELLTLNEEMQNVNVELSQLNNDLSNILSSINTPMIIVGNDLRILRFTPMARKVINLIPTDIGRPIGDIKLNLNIEMTEVEAKIMEVIENMIPKESDVKDKDGRWYSMRIRPYKTLDHKIEGAVVSMIDIDEIERAQNELKDALNYTQAIIETIRESFLVLDSDLRVISVNKSFCSKFTVQAHDLNGKSIYEVAGSQFDVPKLRELLGNILPKQTYFDNFEVFFNFPKIGVKTLLLNARQLYLHGQGKQMILLAIEDITELKLAEEILSRDKENKEILDLQMKLERAKRLSDIGTLASTIAHELRNPLATISVATENIKRKANLPELERSFKNIQKKIMESDQIINNLLFYSRIRSPHFEKVNFYTIIQEYINESKKRNDKETETIKKIDPIKNVLIEADSLQMKELFYNVINNAYDAVPQEGGRIEIEGFDENEYIRITIIDNGPGIDKDDLKRVFDPFFTTKTKGTGLGLTVCHQIADFHEGSINIKSDLGKGTKVTIRLPKKENKSKWRDQAMNQESN